MGHMSLNLFFICSYVAKPGFWDPNTENRTARMRVTKGLMIKTTKENAGWNKVNQKRLTSKETNLQANMKHLPSNTKDQIPDKYFKPGPQRKRNKVNRCDGAEEGV